MVDVANTASPATEKFPREVSDEVATTFPPTTFPKIPEPPSIVSAEILFIVAVATDIVPTVN
jgi:hypothetical protein